jgi:hypothetical protein
MLDSHGDDDGGEVPRIPGDTNAEASPGAAKWFKWTFLINPVCMEGPSVQETKSWSREASGGGQTHEQAKEEKIGDLDAFLFPFDCSIVFSRS